MFQGITPGFMGPVGIDTSGGGGFNPIAETTIDITGLTEIDMTGKTNFGIINLTSGNAVEFITKITNCSENHEYVFRPAPGLTITWADQSDPMLALPNLKLSAPLLVTDGSNYGYVTLQRRNVTFDGITGYFFDIGFLDQYTAFA
jgi:hypothetical protein